MSAVAQPVVPRAAKATGGGSTQAVPDRRRRPLAADRSRDHVPGAVRLHRAHVADDEQPGALAAALAEPVPVEQLHGRLPHAPIWRYGLNTTYYAILATIGVLVSSIPVAYALSRCAGRGRDVAFILVLIAMMLPVQITVIPVYVLFSKLHLIGSLWPLIIPNFLGDAVLDLPATPVLPDHSRGVLGRARVDGCGELRILVSVFLRLAKPAIAAVALFEFLFCFNDFFGPLLYTSENPSHWTLSLGLSQFRTDLPGAVEPDHGRDAALHGAGDHRLLPRAAGVRRGRDPDRGEGMKVAVVGGGSTYTPGARVRARG
jgi:ABC-type glycerol-3-phosphate transport system permease component